MFSRVGFLSLRLKRFPEAVSNLEKSEKIYLAILERDPANRAYQEQLGKLYTRFGYVKETQGDLQGALRAFHKAVEYIEMSNIQGEKKNLLNRRDLAQTLQSAGKVYLKLGDKQKAKESFQKAFDILNGLKAQNALADWDNKMLDELREALQSFD
jgi:tetratricopeptide (TPR) repeat protein